MQKFYLKNINNYFNLSIEMIFDNNNSVHNGHKIVKQEGINLINRGLIIHFRGNLNSFFDAREY